MLTRINRLLSTIIGAFIGALIGHSAYQWWDYRTHPEMYVFNSAPWYTSILLSAAVTLGIVIIAVFIKLLIRRRIR